ncbi:MAG: tRNA uridine-5-carboxymethylaminomethyl(34) synthesis GTPase MnmE [Terriglobia bacterium]
MSGQLEETVAAISTPLGKGGIGIIRISGKDSLEVVNKVFRAGRLTLQDRSPLLGKIIDPHTRQPLDQVLVTYFRAPRSYTREDVIEISGHGSPVLLRAILAAVLESGARLARPGEFSLRAFLNGAIDLVQAEAVRDLIEAQTLFQAKVAQQQAMGALSRRLKPDKSKLLHLISMLEAGIDFADDDVSVLSWSEIEADLCGLLVSLGQLHQSFRFGKIINEGLSIAIIGRPNVGKSSLFNALLDADRAIVTEIPGTTRDLISETSQIRGIPVRFLDTAGIREINDKVERMGIDKSWEAMADADCILFVMDGSAPMEEQDVKLIEGLREIPYYLVINKGDLPQRVERAEIPGQPRQTCLVSARTRDGLEELKEILFSDFCGGESGIEVERGLVTNVRHERLVQEALEALAKASASARQKLPHEILLLDLYSALRALNALTGETTVEDILDNIFSTFCIGK